MRKKRPFFKSRTEWTENLSFYGEEGHRVRVVDARELTQEKAVEKVLQSVCDGNLDYPTSWIQSHAWTCKMNATITNGKVSVRKAKECKR